MFLDEIGEMPVELQVRILRLVQEHEIDKIGSTEPTKVNIRIIAATHRNLEAMRDLSGRPILPAYRGAHRDPSLAGTAVGHPGAAAVLL